MNTDFNFDGLSSAFNFIFKHYGKDIFSAAAGPFTKLWTKFNYAKAANNYGLSLINEHGSIYIMGMQSKKTLDTIFTNLNILEQITAHRRTKEKLLEDIYLGYSSYSDSITEGVDGIHFVKSMLSGDDDDLGRPIKNRKNLFILGKPGSGKTTFVKYITLMCLKGYFGTDYIPIFISLNDLAESNLSLVDYIEKQFKICKFPDAMPFVLAILKRGKCLVVFDGLDEVTKEHRDRDLIIREIRDFQKEYDRNWFFITCRIAAAEYHFKEFQYVEIADFNEDQICSFVTSWFDGNSTKISRFLRNLIKSNIWDFILWQLIHCY